MHILFIALLIWIAAICIFTFALCGADKRAARREEERVPEKRFFALSMLGGALGLGLGMLAFHHKTRHVSFFFAVLIGFALWGMIFFIVAAKSLI